jgi:hypothetical protein
MVSLRPTMTSMVEATPACRVISGALIDAGPTAAADAPPAAVELGPELGPELGYTNGAGELTGDSGRSRAACQRMSTALAAAAQGPTRVMTTRNRCATFAVPKILRRTDNSLINTGV